MKPIPYRDALALLAEEERGPGWLVWCEREGVYQVPVLEWLDTLAEVARSLGAVRPLEVGAGDGATGRALRARGLPLILSDPAGTGAVQRMDARDALVRHRPDLVFSCWLPFDSGVDAIILADPGVRWYLAVVQAGPGFAGSEALWRAKEWEWRRLEEVDRWSVSRMDYLSGTDQGDHVRHGASFLFTRCLR